MDAIDCIKSRRSIRKFHPTKVPIEVLYAVLEAANMAPCAGGLQTWRFLVVEDEASKKVIAKAALKQDWIATAPTIILMCSDPSQLEVEFGKRGREMYDMQNISMAAENLMLAAWNFSVGSTFISSFTEALLRKELKIPDSIHIHGLIPLGYPAEFPYGINRADVEGLIFYETWGGEIRKELEAVSAIAHPERVEMRIGDEIEKRVKKVVEKVKKKVKGKKGKT